MLNGMRGPEKNRNGLVIPLAPAKVYAETAVKRKDMARIDRHHLYFPRVEFLEHSDLAHKFREHRFNSVWLPRFQHERYHKRHDRFFREYPTYLIPSDDVMATFLEEAYMLDELQVCVKAIVMMDDALYEGITTQNDQSIEARQMRVETIHNVVRSAESFSIITPQIYRIALAGVDRVLLNAA